MNESQILAILSDWNFWGTYHVDARDRNTYLKRLQQLFSNRTATTIYGVRRAGKSTLTALFVDRLIATGRFKANDTLIINFEDPRFEPEMDSQTLFQIYETFIKNLNPEKPVIVLDEIQNVLQWEKFARYLLEVKKDYVMITGSSSKLLGQEISTVLTGRHVDMEIMPLSFKEYLDFKGITVSNELDLIREKMPILRRFTEYTRWGGFPEVVCSDSDIRKRELLTRYFEDILFKDIVRRYRIKEVHKLENFATLLLANIATLQSFNKLKSRLRISLDTVERFARFFEMARLFFFLKKFDYSAGRQIRSISKVYVVDPGFYWVKGFKFTENLGRIAENLVAIELMRRRVFEPEMEIYYWKDHQQREVDFVLKTGTEVKELLQVCWNVEDERTHKREIRSLIKAGQNLRCENLTIVTEHLEDHKEVKWNGIIRKIRYVPLWKWLLDFGSDG
ncbi:MAG: ATP-binding protein [Calditrichaeota bacterium]|nr:MAG: ATP-binding protein [Calditrichota bacterium]